MKQIIVLLLVIFLFSCSSSSNDEVVIFEKTDSNEQDMTPANDAVVDNTEESKPLIHIGADEALQIMVRADGAPGMYVGEDGEVYGFYVDLERMVMDEMGQEYEFVPYTDLGPMIQKIKEGTIHSALAAFDVPDYRVLAQLSIPYERLHFVVFTRKDNIDIQEAETSDELIKSLYGKKVGVQTRGHIYQVLREYKEITLLEYPTTTQALADLDAGVVDAVPDVKRIGYYYAGKEGWEIESRGVPIMSHITCTGFSKMLATDVLERYNSALTAVIEDGRYEKLYNSYFGPLDESSRPLK